jgi:hypothetical protein
MPDGKHGPSVKNPNQYEGLRDKGVSKQLGKQANKVRRAKQS